MEEIVAQKIPSNHVITIDYDKIDESCRPLVRFFNERGLYTNMSCEGHNDTNLSM